MFIDRHGKVALGGCRLRNTTSNFGGGLAGWARISIDYAAEIGQADQDYWQVTGLRSEIAGLPAWTGLSSVNSKRTTNDSGLIRGVTVEAESKESIQIGTEHGLSLYPHFTFNESRENGQHILTEKVFVQTLVDEPIPWEEHAYVHQAMQDLLTVAYWKPCGMKVSAASNKKYPLMKISSGEVLTDKWRPVTSVRGGRGKRDTEMMLPTRTHALFSLDDLGVGNLQRWIDKPEEWTRVVGPLVASKYQRGSTVETQLIQTAISIEALGYLVALRENKVQRGKNLSFPQYLKRIHETLDCSVDEVIAGSPHNGIPPFKNYEDWSVAFNEVYKQAKHADHPLPDPLRAVILTDAGALLVRLYLAQEFGVERQRLEKNAKYAS